MAFDQRIADEVCARLAAGESLRRACAAVDGAKAQTVLDWTAANEEFAGQYARARQIGYQLLADEIIEISDDGQNDTYTDDDGNVRTNQEVVARARLRVDSRKWMLSKMLPKVYGDKLELSATVDHTVRPLAQMTDAELLAERERLRGQSKPD